MRNTNRRLGAKGSYLTLVRVADRILWLRGDEMYNPLNLLQMWFQFFFSVPD